MSAAFSLYLDLLRFVAALAVFLSHLDSPPFTDHVLWWRLGLYGDTAVIIFFILSGYVIAHVTAGRETNAVSYFGARASRLLSVSLIGLVLTATFDTIGSTLRPDFYAHPKVLQQTPTWTSYIASALFVNEYQTFNFGGIAPGTNGPYWSLSFEASYYLIAGLLMFSPRKKAITASALILLLAGRTIVCLLPVWFLGFYAYRLNFSPKPRLLVVSIYLSSTLLLLAAPSIENFLPDSREFIYMAWGRGPFNRNLINDYFVASIFAVHILASRELLKSRHAPVETISRILRWLGGLTFPLYLLHYPVLCLVSALTPWGKDSALNAALVMITTTLLVIATTPICEKIRILLRRQFSDEKLSQYALFRVIKRLMGHDKLSHQSLR